MAIQKNITIDGIEVPFKASAAVPRLYRLKFRRDIYQDFAALQKSVGENTEESSALDIESLEVFENIAYIMAKYGMNVIDSGVAVLNMHAPYEVSSKADIYEAVKGWEEPVAIAVLPDHPTPCELRTHTNEPIPFFIWYPGIEPDEVQTFDEVAACSGSYGLMKEDEFINEFMKEL